jgi:photosystem II stability/assembly factor-like uncharacterized protein
MGLPTTAKSFRRPLHRATLAFIAPAAAFALFFSVRAANVPAQTKHILDQRTSTKLIATADPNVKWRITAGDFVERSLDAGATWHGREVAAKGSLLAGSAPNAKVRWVVGRDGLVYVTKDGAKWKSFLGRRRPQTLSLFRPAMHPRQR